MKHITESWERYTLDNHDEALADDYKQHIENLVQLEDELNSKSGGVNAFSGKGWKRHIKLAQKQVSDLIETLLFMMDLDDSDYEW